MTRIEERLRDALSAKAAQVQDGRLRALPGPDPATERKARRRQAWRAWLIPVAAAASVLLIIGLVYAVTRHATQGQPAVSQPPRPSYFVRIVGTGPSNRIEVQSVSTGAVIATVAPPKPLPGGVVDYEALAAAPDDRTFYVEYSAFSANLTVKQVWILSFSLTSSGAATPLTMVRGGLIKNQPGGLETWGNLAVSADGSRLALTVNSGDLLPAPNAGYSDKIIVIDLRSGQREVWDRAGLYYQPGKIFSIQDLSWAADGRSLIFLAVWCGTGSCNGTPGPGGYRDARVYSLGPVGDGATSLNRASVLVPQSARYPVIAQALGGPRGSDLTLAVLSGHADQNGNWPELTVQEFSASGSPRGVDYRIKGLHANAHQVWLTADPSGQHLLVSYAVPGGFTIGWIANGAFHRLPITQPYLPRDATLVIAW
ncbi:MAG: hypothetical protein ACRDOA_07560 [Streptosporangiaceae bacterium]